MPLLLIPMPAYTERGKTRITKPWYMGHVLMENRHGLVVDTRVTKATRTSEWDAVAEISQSIPGLNRVTVGTDKGYNTEVFVAILESVKPTPHVSQNDSNRRSAIDSRATRHAGYGKSQRVRNRIEHFGWMKTIGSLPKTRYRGEMKVTWHVTLTAAAYNLVRIRTLGVGIA